MVKNINEITLTGVVMEIMSGYRLDGKEVFKGIIRVQRKSDTYDDLPIFIPKQVMKQIVPGEICTVDGLIRTRRMVKKDGKYKLEISVLTRKLLEPAGEERENKVALVGFLCKKANYRKTPLGRKIADLLIAVNQINGKTDYIPCICWGRDAELAEHLEAGIVIELLGRLQNREYQKDGVIHTVYEVSINRMETQFRSGSKERMGTDKYE